jgi:hypothetical protein
MTLGFQWVLQVWLRRLICLLVLQGTPVTETSVVLDVSNEARTRLVEAGWAGAGFGKGGGSEALPSSTFQSTL